jgi:hypothetical protein
MAFAMSRSRLAQRRAQAASAGAASWPVAAVVLLASLWIGHYAARASQWSVMTDELQVERLAMSVLGHHTPLPTIHGVRVPIYSQLYPILIAPFYAFPATTAFRLVHVFNAVLMASTAIPVFLTARLVGANRLASVVAAAMTVLVPWVALATTLLTEAAAYPAFVWAIYLLVRALAAPSDRADALALLGLAIAVLARTQFAVLVLLAPFALVLHAGLFRRTAVPGPGWRRALDEILEHRVLIGGYAVAACYVVVRVLTGHSVSALLGTYSGTATGHLLPPGILKSAIAHLDVVAVGAGYVPLVLATAWLLSTIVRPDGKGAHAFAVVTVLAVPALAVEVASFDLRFTPGGFIQERYLYYVVPLLFIAAVMLLGDGRRRWGSLVIAGVICVWLVGRASYAPGTPIFWAAPAAAFHGVLEGRSQEFGSYVGIDHLSIVQLLRWGTLVIGTGICAFLFVESRYVLVRHAMPVVTRSGRLPVSERDWIDRSVPRGARVALLPSVALGDEIWWDAEFWNKRVDLVYATPGATTFTPFPADSLVVERDGEVRATALTPWVVQTPNDTRFGLAGARVVATKGPLALLHTPTPFRAAWAVRDGLFNDGWSKGGQPIEIDAFAVPHAAPRRRLNVSLTNAGGVTETQAFSVAVDGVTRARGRVRPDGTAVARVAVCVRPGAPSRVTVRVRRAVRISDGRLAGLYLGGVKSAPAGQC